MYSENVIKYNLKSNITQTKCFVPVFFFALNFQVLYDIIKVIVNEKNIFSFTGADMHGVTAGNGCARQY